MQTWINFKELRAKLKFGEVLEHFGVEVNRKGNQHKGPCPLPGHVGERKAPTFSAELERGIFRCFGCGGHGNVLEFAALMRGIDPEDGSGMRKVAIELQQAFMGGGKPSQLKAQPQGVAKPAPQKPVVRVVAVNAPLDFELKGLNPDHPYLVERGIEGETARFFGIGVADRGSLKGRLAIPLHDLSGRLVGYAGRVVGDSAVRDDNPKYVFPERRERNGTVHEFRKDAILYNANRIKRPVEELIIVEGFTAAWWFHQSGFDNVVSSMGPTCSEAQVEFVLSLLTGRGRVWIVPKRCAEGKIGNGSILSAIATRCFCRLAGAPRCASLGKLEPGEIREMLGR